MRGEDEKTGIGVLEEGRGMRYGPRAWIGSRRGVSLDRIDVCPFVHQRCSVISFEIVGIAICSVYSLVSRRKKGSLFPLTSIHL
jgi:hypothetical protein